MQTGMLPAIKAWVRYTQRMKEKIRLSKLLSQRGVCSRRDADRHIEKGHVLVDGEVITTLGIKIDPDANVELLTKEKPLTILLNKPIGYVSNQPEKGYRAAIELIRPENQFQGEKIAIPRFKMLSVAGRLDIDSKGLLVLTQDGVIAKQLIGENSEMEKEYLVRFDGKLNDSKLELLCFGLSLDGKSLKRAEVQQLQRGVLQFILKEGKKRQIRRMCEAVDLRVTGLKRVRIGRIKLGKLPEGKWRVLKSSERF